MNLQKGYNSFGFSNPSIPNNGLTEYNFNTLQLESKSPIASSIGISGGETFNVGSKGKLNVFGTVSYGNETNSITDGSVKSINGTGVINKDFEKFTNMSFGTNTTGMANIGYKMNSNHKVNFNTVFINTSTQSKEEYTGYFVDGAEDNNGFIRRNKYDKNTLWINQLLGEHKLSERSKFNWAVSLKVPKGFRYGCAALQNSTNVTIDCTTDSSLNSTFYDILG